MRSVSGVWVIQTLEGKIRKSWEWWLSVVVQSEKENHINKKLQIVEGTEYPRLSSTKAMENICSDFFVFY